MKLERRAAVAFFLASFALFLRRAAPSVTPGDAGEFITAAGTLSLPHAPSFPTWVVLARVFSELVPVGAIGYRTCVFSAFCSALAIALLFLWACERAQSIAAGLAAALALFGSMSFFENALVTEVFALHSLLLIGLMILLGRAAACADDLSINDRERNVADRWIVAACFLLGIGFGNQQVMILAAPCVVLTMWYLGWRSRHVRRWAVSAAALALGGTIYFFLLVRARHDPPMNWGHPATIDRLMRTILRKDYGSLTLALGEAPVRTVRNGARQMFRLARHLRQEMGTFILTWLLVGLIIGSIKRDKGVWLAGLLFLVSGPFFFWLGNLPFDAQSDGVLGRFLIMPALALAAGGVGWARLGRRWMTIVAAACLVSVVVRWNAFAMDRRADFLARDYGLSIFRTLDRDALLVMDGGDDTFYSVASLRWTEGRRRDVRFHDRGGVVFPGLYGEDFRQLTKAEKEERRQTVERAELNHRPLFYSTMELAPLAGAPVALEGFLLRAGTDHARGPGWPLMVLRGLYPLASPDYRTRALAAYFPYMRGRWHLSNHEPERALAWFRRAETMGPDVLWLRDNLKSDYAHLGYEALTSGRLPLAEAVYRQWLDADPMASEAHSNLGVVLERLGRLDEARRQYQRAADLFPTLADPVFNLAVLAWREKKWDEVIASLNEVLRRQPNRADALGYLERAKVEKSRTAKGAR